VRDGHDNNLDCFFAVDYLVREAIHQIKPVSLINPRKPVRIGVNRIQSPIKLRIETFSSALISLCIPTKSFRVFPFRRREYA
jgi:hypothetical protein